ncbi:MAG TPA: PEGA domain-containing protein [Vicinamibacterales bacterium]|nr:PEGA domain-containing protein [Vicinamibacterales bacterium]
MVGAPRILPRIVPSRPLLSQPYYVFRPRQRVGLGLYLGYAVPYPYSYFPLYASVYPYSYDPYSYYPYSNYPYSYYPYTSPAQIYPYTTQTPTSQTPTYPDTVTAAPSTADARLPSGIGGVSFDITPSEAAVFLDGVYVGTVSDFSATAPPLSLAAGRHHFELRAQGYQTLAFDADVMPGQVVPYQGALQPVQAR